jgi:hypothetical protein
MIVFYNLKTGEIYGTIDGRVHNEQQMSGVIRPSNVKDKEVGKYVVSYKPITRKVVKPIYKLMADPKTNEVNNVKVGEQEVEEPAGLQIDDKLSEFFNDVENGKKKIYQYKFAVKKGLVENIIDKQNAKV